MTLPEIDRTLAQRLERAEGSANAAFVEARARVEPSVGATWIDVAGTYAMFDGIASPLTQTFGLGLFAPAGASEIMRIEAFFETRGASTSHEVSELAEAGTSSRLAERGYAPTEDSTVLLRTIHPRPTPPPSDITVRRIDVSEGEHWARVSAEGWSSAGAEVGAFVEQLGRLMAQARGVACFLAEQHGAPIAAAALHLSGDVALLTGASTIPSARGRGAQRALLDARLGVAAAQGISLAMIVTQPGSASQRNAERAGFHAVYGRTKWERRPGGR